MFYNILYILIKSASSNFFTDKYIIKNGWRLQSRLSPVRVVVGSFFLIHISASVYVQYMASAPKILF